MSKQITGFIAWIRTFLDDVYAPKGSGGSITLNDVYPIGSIYMSVNNASPQTLFGGTWVQLTDTFLYASNTADTDSTTAKYGEATHTLTENEMPSHTHKQNPHHHGLNRPWSVSSGSGSAYIQSSNRKSQSLDTTDTTATNQNTGGGQAHNNMPPYMRVYMWKRTA